MGNKVMIAIDKTTKEQFRKLSFPNYIQTDEARIRYIIDKFPHII
jgi:hypothetical protein